MRTSEETDKIDTALAEFQGDLVPVGKNKEVKVDGDRANWKSGYATFAAMLAAVRPLLAKHRLALTQGGHSGANGNTWSVVTRVSHAGQWIEVEYPVKTSRDGAQGFGGGVSFAKRWGLRDVLGIEVADDREEAQGYTDAQREAKPPRRAAAPAGIASALAAIRNVPFSERDAFAREAARARAAFATGEASAEVEKTIVWWLCAALDDCRTVDDLTSIRDLSNDIKPRGLDVRNAIGAASRRLGAP